MSSDMAKKRLAEIICEELQKEFEWIHFSGNLVATLKIEQTNNGWSVEIPAQMYDFAEFRENKTIVHNKGTGSYASAIDKTGGFSKKHKGYLDRCIKDAITRWMNENRMQGKVR